MQLFVEDIEIEKLMLVIIGSIYEQSWYKLLSMSVPFLPQYPKTLEALRLPCAPNICSIVCVTGVCFLSQHMYAFYPELIHVHFRQESLNYFFIKHHN